jgi:hypothetical protein
VVTVVAAPEADELAHQVRLLVAVLGRTDEVDTVGPAGLAQLLHPGTDFVKRLIPGDALIFARHQLHGVAQPVFAVAMLADRRALGAMRTKIDG